MQTILDRETSANEAQIGLWRRPIVLLERLSQYDFACITSSIIYLLSDTYLSAMTHVLTVSPLRVWVRFWDERTAKVKRTRGHDMELTQVC